MIIDEMPDGMGAYAHQNAVTTDQYGRVWISKHAPVFGAPNFSLALHIRMGQRNVVVTMMEDARRYRFNISQIGKRQRDRYLPVSRIR